jgi:phosphoglycolate phosphatase
VLPGVPEVLEVLRSKGKLLGVSSGNLESIGWFKLKAAGLRDFFEFGCFADDCELREHVFREAMDEARRRLGPKATVCFVGDTPDDVRAARGVGGQVIAVGTGIFKVEDLGPLGADATVASCAELLTR